MTGIYIHIPFCVKKCPYCDFFSQTDLSVLTEYMTALKNQTRGLPAREVDSIYIGGGTPSVLSGAQVGELLSIVRNQVGINPDNEITIEVNPLGCDTEKLRAYRNAGINRISVGAQSLNDRTLKLLGRQHSVRDISTALDNAKNAGFNNISVDLILALPDDDEEKISLAVNTLEDKGVKHISFYLLKITEGTPFYDHPPDLLPDDDRTADLYLFIVEKLRSKGFIQYEISNFSQEGYESRHNLKYWNSDEYIGLGAAAHSLTDKKRYSFPADIQAYIDCFSNLSGNWMKGAVVEGKEEWQDYLMLRLRTTMGLSHKSMENRYDFKFNANMKRLLALYETKGLLYRNKDILRLTVPGMLVSNSIISSFLAEAEK